MNEFGKRLYEKTLWEASLYRDFTDEEKNMKHFCVESLKLALAYYLMQKQVEAKSELNQAKECFDGYLWQRRCS